MADNLPPSARKNLGALTTTFSAPSSCGVVDGTFSATSGDFAGQLNGKLGVKCRYNKKMNGQIFEIDDSCFPDGLASYIHDGDAWVGIPPVFSPGLVCPDNYVSACTLERKAGDTRPTTKPGLITASRAIWDMLAVGERAIGCCPSGFACADNDIFKCYTPGTRGQKITGITRSECIATTTVLTAALVQTPSSIAEAQRLLLIQGKAVVQTGSTTKVDPTAALTTAGPSTSKIIEASSPGSSDQDTDSGKSSGGLSKSGKIAIGVTVPTVTIIAGLAIFLFFFMRKKRKTKAAQQMQQVTGNGILYTMPGPKGTAFDRAELVGNDGRAFTELHGETHITPELDGQARHEMPQNPMHAAATDSQFHRGGP